jgi:hypothetical protein
MKIAYIILAHKNPEQLVRLIHRLQDENTSFFVHLDQKTSHSVYSQLLEQLRDVPDILFVKRYRCYWGNYGIVNATIEAIKQLVRSTIDFDYAILLSGQDYPIKSIASINAFLDRNHGSEFMDSFALTSYNRWTDQGDCYQALNRVQYWHFRIRSRHFYPPIKRPLPKNFALYGGSQWWCLTRECINYVNAYIANHPAFVNYFKHTFIPDELFFQTIVSNSPFRANMIHDDLRFIDWDHPNPVPPATMLKADFDRLVASPKLFARKFDITRDAEIFDLIDQHILNAMPVGR